MTLKEMEGLAQKAGVEAYRAKQLFQWIYGQGIDSLERATNLPQSFRSYLAEHVGIGLPALAWLAGPGDSTQKLALELRDKKIVESVLMRDQGRVSLCVSTQVGCALACQFCLTGVGGYQRNLAVGEIVGQALAARRLLREGEILNNMVFMGMGEPLLNLDNVVAALRLIGSPQAIGMAPRRITVSTAGIAPAIPKFGEAATGANLAVSLNATTDEVRNEIMPINRRYPIASLLEACRVYPIASRQRITFEYVLLRGVNDSIADARRLPKLVKGIPCKINLIVFNRHEALPFEPASADRLNEFCKILSDSHFTVAVRHSKGRDLQAACGQLAGHVERFRRPPVNEN